jgi:putative membrane protein
MKQPVSIVIALLALALAAFGHEGEPHNASELFGSWAFDPLVVVSLLASAAVYAIGVSRLWRTTRVGGGIGGWEALAFSAGWLSLVVALVSPLHPWGEVLFSAHMTQHEILMLISAPLIVLGRPLIATMWALPRSRRNEAGGILKAKPLDAAWDVLTNPAVAFGIHALALWIWHIPYLFQATLNSDLVHTLQHISFFGSALLFWWAIIYGRRGLSSYGAGVLYLFATSIHSGLLGAFLTFTQSVWYPIYSDSTAAWGLTPIVDQQLGGLIMWVPAGIVYIVAALIMFAGWLRESEKRVVMRERQAISQQV